MHPLLHKTKIIVAWGFALPPSGYTITVFAHSKVVLERFVDDAHFSLIRLENWERVYAPID